MWCSKIEKFPLSNVNNKDFFIFCDRIYVITVKKDKLTKNQQDCIKNINKLGCTNKTFWCYSKGYKDKKCPHS